MDNLKKLGNVTIYDIPIREIQYEFQTSIFTSIILYHKVHYNEVFCVVFFFSSEHSQTITRSMLAPF